MVTELDIKLLTRAAKLAGFNDIKIKDIVIEVWLKVERTHKPKRLQDNYFAVYMFMHGKTILKVGKVSGEKNNDRYNAHHYLIKGASSTLAKSLSKSSRFSKFLMNENPRKWITANTTRFNILIPKQYGAGFVNFTEAFFILKLKPLFEGKIK